MAKKATARKRPPQQIEYDQVIATLGYLRRLVDGLTAYFVARAKERGQYQIWGIDCPPPEAEAAQSVEPPIYGIDCAPPEEEAKAGGPPPLYIDCRAKPWDIDCPPPETPYRAIRLRGDQCPAVLRIRPEIVFNPPPGPKNNAERKPAGNGGGRRAARRRPAAKKTR